jgi:hypothetical protein
MALRIAMKRWQRYTERASVGWGVNAAAHKKAWMAQGWGRGVLLRLEAGQSATLTATLLSSEEESAEGLLTLGTVTESLNILTSYASLTGTLQVRSYCVDIATVKSAPTYTHSVIRLSEVPTTLTPL